MAQRDQVSFNVWLPVYAVSTFAQDMIDLKVKFTAKVKKGKKAYAFQIPEYKLACILISVAKLEGNDFEQVAKSILHDDWSVNIDSWDVLNDVLVELWQTKQQLTVKQIVDFYSLRKREAQVDAEIKAQTQIQEVLVGSDIMDDVQPNSRWIAGATV
jgi:hypothetical protein